MYQVVTISGGKVVAQFTERMMAMLWCMENNTDEKGDPLALFKVVKAKHKKAQEAA